MCRAALPRRAAEEFVRDRPGARLGGGHGDHRSLRLPDVHRFYRDRAATGRAVRSSADRFLRRARRQERDDRDTGANLDKAAEAATRACFSNAGQLCISIERIYVEQGIAEEFTAKFADVVRKMKLDTGYDFSADMGSLISEGQLKAVTDHVEDARERATVVAGGKGPPRHRPAVL